MKLFAGGRGLVAVLLGALLLGAPATVGAQAAPTVAAREYRAPSVSAKDGAPLTLALTEKHRADLDPGALAAGGRIVLLTHGSTFSGQVGSDVQVPGVPLEQSASVLDQLALRGYDVWTLAYQNYGASDRHDCGLCVDTEAAAGDVEAAVRFILATRRVGRLHLIGWSWGGQTAGLVAQRRPDLVNRLVLTGPLLHRQAGAPPTEEFRSLGAGQAVIFSPAGSVPEVVAAFLEAVAAAPPTPNGALRDQRTDPLKVDPGRLTAPTLVIYGADDVLTPPDGPDVGPFFERLAAAEKRFVVVPEAGHALFMERQAARWYEAVLAHLEPGNSPPGQVPRQLPRTGAVPWPALPAALAGLALVTGGALVRRLRAGPRATVRRPRGPDLLTVSPPLPIKEGWRLVCQRRRSGDRRTYVA